MRAKQTRFIFALAAVFGLTTSSLPAAQVYQGDNGETHEECGINRNATDSQGNRYHAAANQPLAQGYNDEGTVPAYNYHTSTGTWYRYSQEVGIHESP